MVLTGELPFNAVLLPAAAAVFLRRVQPGFWGQEPVHPGVVLWGRATSRSCCHVGMVQVMRVPSHTQVWSSHGRVGWLGNQSMGLLRGIELKAVVCWRARGRGER